MRKAFTVRFVRVLDADDCRDALWSEWIDSRALGPFAAALQIIRDEDWSDYPLIVRVQVYDDLSDYEYLVTVDKIMSKVITVSPFTGVI